MGGNLSFYGLSKSGMAESDIGSSPVSNNFCSILIPFIGFLLKAVIILVSSRFLRNYPYPFQ